VVTTIKRGLRGSSVIRVEEGEILVALIACVEIQDVKRSKLKTFDNFIFESLSSLLIEQKLNINLAGKLTGHPY
jgi:hypothetical protein